MTKPRTIKTAICIDWMGTSFQTADEEFDEIRARWIEELKPHTLSVYRAHSCYPGGIEEGTELVLFDFGGALPGTDMSERNTRHLIRWAEEHPSSLVCIISDWSYDHLVLPLMEELGLAKHKEPYADEPFAKPIPVLPNIILNCFGDSLPEWFSNPQSKPKKLKRKARLIS